jgi:hypothetical protein
MSADSTCASSGNAPFSVNETVGRAAFDSAGADADEGLQAQAETQIAMTKA